LDDFAKSCKSVDRVVVVDIYGSAREQQGGIHARDVVAAINDASKNAVYGGTLEETANMLRREAKAGDVIITMGAGDVWKVADEYIHRLGRNR